MIIRYRWMVEGKPYGQYWYTTGLRIAGSIHRKDAYDFNKVEADELIHREPSLIFYPELIENNERHTD